jgi:DNA mismatch repair protein MutS2
VVDQHSLNLLEFDRVTAAIAEAAASATGRARLAAWGPIAERAARTTENARLAEAIARQAAPGAWCATGEGTLGMRIDPAHRDRLDGPGLREVLGWLEAGRETRAVWDDEVARARHPRLAALADGVPPLEALRARIAGAIEPDGRVADAASPALRRARAGLADGERELGRQLERFARGFGENAYVTRHGERFVALVPAAGFPRRRGIVHDVSGSGHSLFVEPLEACEANNRLLELRATVADEERRVLSELAAAVRDAAVDLAALEEALVHLDTLRARARWALAVRGVAIDPAGASLRLAAARHPLLAMGERADAAVPLDLSLGEGGRVLLVSGPNMGGKTVLLKTVGLAVALAHAALPVPASEGSAVPELDTVLADLGDEQSVDQGLSTFAAHLRTLKAMAGAAGPRALLLCDELGAGTDPDEGGALGRALIEHLASAGAWAVVTTHLGSLKRVAGEVGGVVHGSLEFDAETFTSRYRFVPGVPGASHALSVAERLGFPRDLLARARALAPESVLAMERLLAELAVARARLGEERESLRASREAADAEAARLRVAREDQRRDLEALRRRLTAESEAVLARARELWQTVQREARRADKSRATAHDARARIEAAEREVRAIHAAAAAALEAAGASATPARLASVDVGQRVRVEDLGVEAEVVSAPDDEGRVTLRRGSWTIQSHVSKLAAAEGAARGDRPAPVATWEGSAEAPPLEVDLRGLEVDEAIRTLDGGLDRAVVGGLGELRVIHGVGRGVLRAAVERHLRGHPQVAEQRLGATGEGGRGVTIARLR